MTVKAAFQKLYDYAVKRRDDPDNSPTTTQYWVGYLDALKALKPVIVGTNDDKGETK
jgi:hypothetical protein